MSPANKAEGNSLKVFISYCSADEKYAKQINDQIRESGLDTYFAPESNRTGDEWRQTIDKETENCCAMVLLISPHSKKSSWFKREIDYYTLSKTDDEKNGIKRRECFPIILYGVKKEDLDREIRRLQCCDCSSVIDNSLLFANKIDEVISDIKVKFCIAEKNCVEIPVITFAMTRQQAQDLVSEAIFLNPDATPAQKTRYKRLRAALKQHGLSDLETIVNSYSDSVDEWQPLVANGGKTIREIVKDIEKRVNQNSNQFVVKTRFLSEQVLNGSADAPSLQYSKCILIIDAISLFHPILYKTLAEDVGYPQSKSTNLMLIVVPPIGHSEIAIYKFLEETYVSLKSMKPAFKMFSENLETGYELGIGNKFSLSRWLTTSLTQIANQEPSPDEEKSKKFIDANKKVEGFRNLLAGRG